MTRLLLILLLISQTYASNPTFAREAPLGLPTRFEYYVPGSKIEVTPRKNSDSSLVIRIIQIKPADDGHRYDLEVYGLDPGTHHLTDFLRYADTKSPLPALPGTFKVTTQHPLDTLPKPAELEAVPPHKLGGYQTLITLLGILWFIILLAIIFYRKTKNTATLPDTPPPTLHQKLQDLVSQASHGNLPDTERAKLERLIIGHWTQKLPELQNLPPARALVELRTHPEASPLILKLEHWLHAPNTSLSHQEIIPLLSPYKKTQQPITE